jgi:hypothetical protein
MACLVAFERKLYRDVPPATTSTGRLNDTAANMREEQRSAHKICQSFRPGNIPGSPEVKRLRKVILITDYFLSIRYYHPERTGRILI